MTKRVRWRWSLQSYFLAMSIFASLIGGGLVLYQWRNRLFYELESLGNEPNASCRAITSVNARWFGLFGSDFSNSAWSKEKPWWLEYTLHRYVATMHLYVSKSKHPMCDSVLSHRESLRGLTSLGLYGMDLRTLLIFPSSAAKLPDVRELRLSNVLLSKKDLLAISRMQDLEILELSRCHLQVEDLAELRWSKNLAWLILNQEIPHNSIEKIREELPSVHVSMFQPGQLGTNDIEVGYARLETVEDNCSTLMFN